ncbi:hypothetical protein N5923_18180 [Erwiniaceae bacterium BAC15a-03b]|uniref:Uncharacterized protein n=2 Tax=Winslowiella arboricola TaxID=2978220 RepID=A0A9J6PRS4_9GAMM|nr:hypothetical protein [Winslowiella arboricola]MCU5779414.1 hypothetical protein [Winslowiella arboricola]
MAQRELLERGVRRAALLWAGKQTANYQQLYVATGLTEAQAHQRALTLTDQTAIIMAHKFTEAADRDAWALSRMHGMEMDEAHALLLRHAINVLKRGSTDGQ